MASSSSSMLYDGTTETADNMELMTDSQQEWNLELPTSLAPAQNNHLFPNKQRNDHPEASYPNADLVIAVSPNTLLDPNRYVCEVCFKGFARNQNLSLHRRTHNLPFTFKKKTPNDHVPRKVYLCPEPTCVHHNRSHALGDFCGLKKHYLRKHSTEKKYKCDKCPKAYGVETDLKSHSKICTRKNYSRHFGSVFSREKKLPIVGDSQTVYVGDSSVKNTIDKNNIPIGSTMSHPRTLVMGDNTMITKSNENSSNILDPQIPWIQNQTNSYPCTTPYQSQLCHFGADHTGFITDTSMGINMSQITPSFFSPTSTHHIIQPGCHESSNIGLYADQLREEIRLNNMNLEDMSQMGYGGNNYGTVAGSKSSLDGVFMPDFSNSLHMTPAMDDRRPYGMLNPVTGCSDGGLYEQRVYNDYGVGSANLEYGGGVKVFNFEHQQQQQQGGYPN